VSHTVAYPMYQRFVFMVTANTVSGMRFVFRIIQSWGSPRRWKSKSRLQSWCHGDPRVYFLRHLYISNGRIEHHNHAREDGVKQNADTTMCGSSIINHSIPDLRKCKNQGLLDNGICSPIGHTPETCFLDYIWLTLIMVDPSLSIVRTPIPKMWVP
jgi:hypothetical protein